MRNNLFLFISSSLMLAAIWVMTLNNTASTLAASPTSTPVPSKSKTSAPRGAFGSVTVVNSDSNTYHNETSIAIDPTNPNRVLATAQLWLDASSLQPFAYYYTSTNGGATWVQGDTTKSNGATWGGDPWVTFDKNGNGYQVEKAHISSTPDGIYLARLSTSDRWSESYPITLPVSGFADKPFVATDRTSGTFANRVYVTWAWDDGSTRAIYMRSTDWTTTPPTFSSQVRVSTPVTDSQWSYIAVGTDGAVYVAYLSYGTGAPNNILLAKSMNGGVSFTNTYTISVANGVYNFFADQLLGASGKTLSANNGPMLVSHPTDANKLAAVWMDGYGCSLPNRCLHGHIVSSYSTNGGANWSSPVVVNDDGDAGNRDHFLPALAVGSDGVLHTSWYDRRVALNCSNPYLYNVVYSSSSDWGQTWSRNMKVSTASSNPANPNFGAALYNLPNVLFVGDYSGIAVTNDGSAVMPFWTDATTGVQNVATSRAATPINGLSIGTCLYLPLIVK